MLLLSNADMSHTSRLVGKPLAIRAVRLVIGLWVRPSESTNGAEFSVAVVSLADAASGNGAAYVACVAPKSAKLAASKRNCMCRFPCVSYRQGRRHHTLRAPCDPPANVPRRRYEFSVADSRSRITLRNKEPPFRTVTNPPSRSIKRIADGKVLREV